MKNNHLFFGITTIAAVILMALIVLKMSSGRTNPTKEHVPAEPSSVKKSAGVKANLKAAPSAVADTKAKDNGEIQIQRLLDEMCSLNSKKLAIPQTEGIIRELSAFGNAAIPAISKLLASDANANIKSLAARVLAQIGTSESVETLMNAISSESDPVCKDLFTRTLQAVDKAEASPALIKALGSSKDVFLTTETKEAIARTGNEDTVKQLVEACRGQAQMTPSLSNMLGALAIIRQPETVPALSSIASSEQNPQIRKSALRALSSMGYPESTQALVDIFNSEKTAENKTLLLDAISVVHSKESLDLLRQISTNNANPEGLRKAASRAIFTIVNGVPPAE